MSWAQDEFNDIALGDKRLNTRAATLLDTLGAKPSVSIPAACRGWAETQAAYRFFDQANVRADTVLEPHAQRTLERAQSHPVVLAIADTTELDYTGKNDIEGLGPLSYEAQRGMYCHPTFLLTPERLPLGVFDAWLWARAPEDFGKAKAKANLPIEAKESVRWLEGYQRLAESAEQLPDTRIVYLADREADIYELFVEARRTDTPAVDVLIRAQHDRRLEGDDDTLFEALGKATALGEIEFALPNGASSSRQRVVTQTLHAKRVKLKAPQGKASKAPFVEMTAVLAREIDTPDGQAPVQWLLLTTLAVDTFEQAAEILAWYLCRWEVELLFKVLKSGCEIEELQLEHIDRLQPAIAMYLIIAWRVMLLKMAGRQCPDMACDTVFETEEWQAIYTVTTHQPPPEQPPPLDTIVRMLAAFGGYLNRKHDGPPGNKTIWIGLQRCRDFVLALHAYRASGP